MRQPLTVSVDENVLDALRRAAARDGVPEDELVDEALRRWFGLRGLVVLDDIADRRAGWAERLDDAAALDLALQEVRVARAGRPSNGS
ncbi:MAG: CopG family transcriptional regulator [Acidimicrobiales bacterium]